LEQKPNKAIRKFYLRYDKMIPNYFFLTKGVGKHKEQLQSFELALRNAGIHHCNLVNVSSIVPPGCKMLSREQGLQMVQPGEITFVVLARNATKEPHRLVASSIGVAIPSGKNHYGYLSEHHSFGQTDEAAGDYAEDLAATMLATTMGIQFDPETAWDERKQLFKTSGMIIKTANITQSATGDKNGLWTTTIAAAVFVPAENSKLLKKRKKKP
jgi:arginine decarboxylase